MAGDLHTHSTFSDGSVKAEMLPFYAARAGLTSLAVSDHDSILSVRFAHAHPRLNGVELVPATELTAYDYEREHRVHLLCYWPDDCAPLEAYCTEMGRRRHECCLQSCRELEELYPQFTTEQALRYCRDSGVLYKSGIMQALREIGLTDVIYGDLYKELFNLRPWKGKVIHTPKYEDVDTMLELIKACRGVVIFAHPSVYHSMPLVRQLAAEGRIDGVEIDHPRNTEEDKAELRQLAQKYDLIVTGGTDYHGSNTKRPHPLGTCTTEDDQLERIRKLAQERKGL